MSDISSKNQPKSSTQRARDFRAREREKGGAITTMMLTPLAQASLEIIRSFHKSSKIKAVEAALLNEAKRICCTDDEVKRLVRTGVLPKAVANAWLHELRADELLAHANTEPFP